MWSLLAKILTGALSLLAPFLLGRATKEAAHQKELKKEALDEAQDFANMPLTDDDFNDRMSGRIESKKRKTRNFFKFR